MKLNKFFNLVVLLFCGLVPLLPMKYKLGPIPISSDFILGSLIILTGLLLFVKNIKNKNELTWIIKDTRLRVLTILITIFTALAFFSVTYARTKGVVITESLRFLEYVLIFYGILGFLDKNTIEKCIKVFYLSLIISSIWGICQFAFNLSNFTNGGLFNRGRVYGTFFNPNYWGAAINLVIFYPIINILEKRNIKLNIIIFLLFFSNLLLCSTRGSWIGFGLGLMAMGFIRYRKLVGVSAGLFLSMFILPITRHRFIEILNIWERTQLLRTGLLMFKDYFVRGVGNGNYIYEYKHYVKWHPELFLGRTKFSVHNSYLKIFIELGVFGGVLFLSIYLLLFKIIIDVYRATKGNRKWILSFLCFGVSYLVQNLSNNLMFIPQLNVFVWIFCGMIIRGLYLDNRDHFKSRKIN